MTTVCFDPVMHVDVEQLHLHAFPSDTWYNNSLPCSLINDNTWNEGAAVLQGLFHFRADRRSWRGRLFLLFLCRHGLAPSEQSFSQTGPGGGVCGSAARQHAAHRGRWVLMCFSGTCWAVSSDWNLSINTNWFFLGEKLSKKNLIQSRFIGFYCEEWQRND